MEVGYGFEPHRLPDAADRGVPDAPRFERLLAARLVAGRGRVGDLHDEFVGAGAQIAGDVETERIGAALVAAHDDAVDEHGRFEIDRAEMQQRALTRPRSEEHTSELQSLMRISYAVSCLKKKKQKTN